MFPSGQVDSHADQKLLNMATLEAAAVSRDQRTCLGLATHPRVSPSPLLPLLRSGSRSAAQIRETQCTKDSAAIRIPHIWYNQPQATFLPLVCSQAERFPAGLSPALPCRSRTCRAIVCIPVPPVVPMPVLQLEVMSLGSSGPSKPCSDPARPAGPAGFVALTNDAQRRRRRQRDMGVVAACGTRNSRPPSPGHNVMPRCCLSRAAKTTGPLFGRMPGLKTLAQSFSEPMPERPPAILVDHWQRNGSTTVPFGVTIPPWAGQSLRAAHFVLALRSDTGGGGGDTYVMMLVRFAAARPPPRLSKTISRPYRPERCNLCSLAPCTLTLPTRGRWNGKYGNTLGHVTLLRCRRPLRPPSAASRMKPKGSMDRIC